MALQQMPVQTFVSGIQARYQLAYAQTEGVPTAYQPSLFSQMIYDVSRQNLADVRTILYTCFPELNDPSLGLAVVLTGSDGRMEKASPDSPIELIVISRSEYLSPQALVTKEKIKQLVKNEELALFFMEVEEKNLDTEDVSVFVEPKKTITVPTRVLDAQFIAGDPNLFITYKDKLKRELDANPKILTDFRAGFFRKALKTLEAEILNKRKPLAVDVASGALLSDGHYLKGPKYGMMRTIQYSIALSIFRNSPQMSEEELRSIPSTIPQRIDWLREKNFIDLTIEEGNQLKSCYAQAILWSGALQRKAQNQGASEKNVISLQVDSLTLGATLQKTKELATRILSEKAREAPLNPVSPTKRPNAPLNPVTPSKRARKQLT